MTQTTSTTSTQTPTRASCTTCEQALRARSFVTPLDVCVTRTSWLKVFLSLIPSTFIVIHERFSFDFTFLPFYFDLSFSIFFHFSFLMHLEQHTELDNLITVQHNLRLGKLLDEAHREHADHRNPEGVSVSQSSLSVVVDRTGKTAGDRDVDQLIGFWCHEKHVQCSQQVFWKTPKLRKWSIEQGNLRSETAQMHRLGPYLMNRDR